MDENQPAQNPWIPAPRPQTGLSAPPPMAWEYAQAQPAVARSDGKRIAMLLGILGALFAVSVAVLIALMGTMDPNEYATPEEYDAALDLASMGSSLVLGPILVGAFVWLCPRVGYRRRDALFLFVPLWMYFFTVKILWRATALPDRDWPERLDTAPQPAAADAEPEVDIWA